MPSELIVAVKRKAELIDLGLRTVISELIWPVHTFVRINRHGK